MATKQQEKRDIMTDVEWYWFLYAAYNSIPVQYFINKYLSNEKSRSRRILDKIQQEQDQFLSLGIYNPNYDGTSEYLSNKYYILLDQTYWMDLLSPRYKPLLIREKTVMLKDSKGQAYMIDSESAPSITQSELLIEMLRLHEALGGRSVGSSSPSDNLITNHMDALNRCYNMYSFKTHAYLFNVLSEQMILNDDNLSEQYTALSREDFIQYKTRSMQFVSLFDKFVLNDPKISGTIAVITNDLLNNNKITMDAIAGSELDLDDVYSKTADLFISDELRIDKISDNQDAGSYKIDWAPGSFGPISGNDVLRLKKDIELDIPTGVGVSISQTNVGIYYSLSQYIYVPTLLPNRIKNKTMQKKTLELIDSIAESIIMDYLPGLIGDWPYYEGYVRHLIKKLDYFGSDIDNKFIMSVLYKSILLNMVASLAILSRALEDYHRIRLSEIYLVKTELLNKDGGSNNNGPFQIWTNGSDTWSTSYEDWEIVTDQDGTNQYNMATIPPYKIYNNTNPIDFCTVPDIS